MAFPTRAEYETLLYRITIEYPQVSSSTVHLYSTSALTAIVRGELLLQNGLRLRIVEVVDFKKRQITASRESGAAKHVSTPLSHRS